MVLGTSRDKRILDKLKKLKNIKYLKIFGKKAE